jgi:hypothetical protein
MLYRDTASHKVTVTLEHVYNIGQSEARYRKYKRFKLDVVKHITSSDYTAIIA